MNCFITALLLRQEFFNHHKTTLNTPCLNNVFFNYLKGCTPLQNAIVV